MHQAAILLIGFSFFYVLVFVLTHFKNSYYHDQKTARVFGILLMLCLAVLQLYHYNYLMQRTINIDALFYLSCLYLVAPSFYFYARPVLKAEDEFKLKHFAHFMPLLLVFTIEYNLAFTLAFVSGSLYLLWLFNTIYALRTHKQQFKNELILLTMVFIIAISVSVIALTKPFSQQLFFTLYACAIGLALFVVALVVSYKPELSEIVSEAAKETYAVSTLTAVDCEAKLAQLESLMKDNKLYQQHNVDRHTIATELDLTTHQLSELINTKLNMGFSHYLRLQRINAAKRLLLSQHTASVLSIGLEVGFSSQSNFYEAFKDITKTTPGKYRSR